MWDGLGWVVRMSWLGFVGFSHRPREASHIPECGALLNTDYLITYVSIDVKWPPNLNLWGFLIFFKSICNFGNSYHIGMYYLFTFQ